VVGKLLKNVKCVLEKDKTFHNKCVGVYAVAQLRISSLGGSHEGTASKGSLQKI